MELPTIVIAEIVNHEGSQLPKKRLMQQKSRCWDGKTPNHIVEDEMSGY
jgi:hypothetical protein